MDLFFTNNESAIVASNRILYTPSSFAKSSLLFLQEIGSLTALKPHVSSRSNLLSFLFFVVTDGEGWFSYKDNSYHLKSGDCVFIDCKYRYSHTTSPDHLWSLSWCHFFGPTLSLIYEKYVERGGRPKFTSASPDQFSSLLDSLYQMAESNDFIRDVRINEGLNSLITLLMNESWHPEDGAAATSKKASVIPVKDYLDKNYRERITLDSLAAEFYINKYYLTRVFREQFGMSITAYLLNLRITRAKQMLRFTNKSIGEIGLECGIGALHYFSRVFKEVEGVAPSVYRKQW